MFVKYDFFFIFVKAELIKLAGMAGVMEEADYHAYSNIWSTWKLHRLATSVPSIACVINCQSIFVDNLDLSNFESGLPYFDFYLSVSCWSIL